MSKRVNGDFNGDVGKNLLGCGLNDQRSNDGFAIKCGGIGNGVI